MISRANSPLLQLTVGEAGGLFKASTLTAGHGTTQAPLHATDLWIGLLCTLHPVQPHRQLAGHCYFGHAVVLPGLQAREHAAQIFISSGGTACPFHQKMT